jgi:hypothetical protein
MGFSARLMMQDKIQWLVHAVRHHGLLNRSKKLHPLTVEKKYPPAPTLFRNGFFSVPGRPDAGEAGDARFRIRRRAETLKPLLHFITGEFIRIEVRSQSFAACPRQKANAVPAGKRAAFQKSGRRRFPQLFARWSHPGPS